jgi:hemoglobin-like flavoprotein
LRAGRWQASPFVIASQRFFSALLPEVMSCTSQVDMSRAGTAQPEQPIINIAGKHVMVNDAVARLEENFNLLAPRGLELVDRFYAHLFSSHPQIRAMFPQDMTTQKRKLLSSIVLIAKNLRNPERIREPVFEMGRRHEAYGTQPEIYPIFRDTLIGVMRDMAVREWSEQLTEDWTAALDAVIDMMLEGYAVEAKSPKYKTRDVARAASL